MTLKAGQRVLLAADTRLTDSAEVSGVVVGFLSLAAGIGGTVEQVDVHHPQAGDDVREYERLKSLLDAYGDTMPPGSRKRFQEQVASLEPTWTAFQELAPRVSVRVRFDNGFLLDGADEGAFVPA
ncbi:hypothetical protein GCM10010329_68220 [Streptomyces spiroverticillatus]|uniref:Uncharacterized protein n=1 Tax=Streptomyces finlayi TaxID=67296 RepID=A0A918X538_9ACTN|nr:hypothetical protein [Streptomyces finlayi]GHA35399.1 hypothetical protein GCM10010329_68220 [Streptomyces spiroverticillatus]GHD12880.1 hypothetical protein GCM10010334_70460 [Streptomyces finlayi]